MGFGVPRRPGDPGSSSVIEDPEPLTRSSSLGVWKSRYLESPKDPKYKWEGSDYVGHGPGTGGPSENDSENW